MTLTPGTPHDQGWVLLAEAGEPAGAARLAWLAPAERAIADAFPTEKRRGDWILGRAAAKEAVAALLAREGRRAPPRTDVVVTTTPSGAPSLAPLDLCDEVGGPSGEAASRGRPAHPATGGPIVVSLSHGHGLAAGWALRSGPSGGLPGIDLERVRPRPIGTFRFYLTPEEREPVLALEGGAADRAGPRDDLAIVLWAVKEAAFKALRPPRGMGLLDVRVDDPQASAPRVRYTGGLLARAEALGARDVRAGWTRHGDVVVAWVEVVGATDR